MKLYRYVRALEKNGEESVLSKKLIDTLQGSKINFSHPASFNDPLECTIPIKINDYDKYKVKYLDSVKSFLDKRIGTALNSMSRRRWIDDVIEFGIPLEYCLVTCFSKEGEAPLMWSHYADQYKGVRLCYEFPDTKEEFLSQVVLSDYVKGLEKSNLDFMAGDVKYEDKRRALELVTSSNTPEEWKFANDYNMQDAIFVKPKYWEYEKEWRLVLYLPFGGERAFAAGVDTSDCFISVPKIWLKEIAFGLRLQDDYRKEIVDILNSNGYGDVSLCSTKLEHGKFDITTVPYLPT